jgi:hypothetical protein
LTIEYHDVDKRTVFYTKFRPVHFVLSVESKERDKINECEVLSAAHDQTGRARPSTFGRFTALYGHFCPCCKPVMEGHAVERRSPKDF